VRSDVHRLGCNYLSVYEIPPMSKVGCFWRGRTASVHSAFDVLTAALVIMAICACSSSALWLRITAVGYIRI
jgi:hypothetical protein